MFTDVEINSVELAGSVREFLTEFTGYDPGLPICQLFTECIAEKAANHGQLLTLHNWRGGKA